MRMYNIIAKKRDGGELTESEIKFVINGYTKNEIPDYQMSALLMAIFLKGMTMRETVSLTLAMAHSGETVDLSDIKGIKVDKHSTGGVGDKTTLVIAPVVASLGVPVAKMSGRGLGNTGGTIDKLMSIPNMRTAFTKEEFISNVKKCGICLASQSEDLAPADKKLYALRDATGTVESIPLIASSIMSKKIASGADRILLDVKFGSGAFMKNIKVSKKLAQTMIEIGKLTGKKTLAIITDMNKPLGFCIGNSLEVIEAIETLKGKGPSDLEEECIELAANMLYLAEKGTADECRRKAADVIKSGSAIETLRNMIKTQGGNTEVIDDYSLFGKSPYEYEVKADREGYISSMQTEKIGEASALLGAGRLAKESAIDYTAGIILKAKTGDYVSEGDILAALFTKDKNKIMEARQIFNKALFFSSEKPPALPLVLYRTEN